MKTPQRVFHIERLTRYKSVGARFRVFEQTPSGLRPLVNDNGRQGREGITYPFQTYHLDRHRRPSYEFVVTGEGPAFELLCSALAAHFGEPIGIYRLGMTMYPVRTFAPAAASLQAGAASRPARRRTPSRSDALTA